MNINIAPFGVEISIAALIAGGLYLLVQISIILYLLLNIRNRRKAEKQLRESEERLSLALNGTNDALWDWNVLTHDVVFSPRFFTMLDYDAKSIEPTDQGWRKLLHPDEIAGIEVALQEHFAGKTENYSIEHRFRARSGEWRWVLARGKVVERTEDGRPSRMVGTYADVSDRHRVDETIQTLLRATSSATQADFFRQAALNIADSMGVEFALIGQISSQNPKMMQTLSVCIEGKQVEDFSFSTESVCFADVITSCRSTVIQNDHPGLIFPEIDGIDEFTHGFVCAPVIGGESGVLGLVMAGSKRPIDNPDLSKKILEIFAGKIAGEIARDSVTKALFESERLWQFALEGSGDGVWDWNLETGEVFYSQTYKQMLGYNDQEFPNRLESWMTLVHPDDIGYVMSEHERHIQAETESIHIEYRIKCKEGYYKWILGRGKTIERREDGAAVRLVGTHTDITLRKASEQVLHDTMAKFQSLFFSMSEGFAYHQVVFNANHEPVDYMILDVNPTYSTILSIPREKAVGALASRLYGTDPAPFLDVYSRVALTGVSDHLEVFFEPMGKYFAVAIFSPERGRFATVFSDMTERISAERKMSRERNLLRTVVDNIPDAIAVKDNQYRRTMANRTDYSTLGARTEKEVLGKTEGELLPTELAASFHDLDRYVFETGMPIVNREIAYLFPGNSQTRWAVVSRIPLFDENGAITGLVDIRRDITERKSSEQEIRRLNAELEERVRERTSQLEMANKELEAFSYSVSHDLRAPLRSIEGFSLALLEDYAAQLDETGVNYLNRIRASSQRMGSLINDLLKLSRITRTNLHRDLVDLSAMARDVVQEIQSANPERQVNWIIKPGLTVNADSSLMRIVLENLLGNAWKFTGKHRSATIEFSKDKVGESIVYYVKDDGAGFDPQYNQNLFAPFQRMHSASDFEGTGIGLATVQRIIHRHGGAVWVESQIEQGATFFFTLG